LRFRNEAALVLTQVVPAVSAGAKIPTLACPGAGKTHLSVAQTEAAIRSDMGAYFITGHDLAADLGRAYREGRLDRRMRVSLAPKVLLIAYCASLQTRIRCTALYMSLQDLWSKD